MKFGLNSSDPSVGSYQSNKQYTRALHSDIEKQSMKYDGLARNPVIVIHGFLGSKLIDIENGEGVWGDFKEVDLLRGFSKNQLSKLALPLEYGKSLKDLKDYTVSAEVLTKYSIRVLGFHIEKGAYGKMVETLLEAGYIDTENHSENNTPNLFKFFYDWRRDISENAQELHKFILTKKRYLQNRYEKLYNIKNFDVQFDIVAHSLGGLLTRYYLRYGDQILPDDYSQPKLTWGGREHIDKVMLVGTPNGGYLDAFSELINGLKIVNYGPILPPEVIGTFPSYYQMLPATAKECLTYCGNSNHDIDIFDYKTWVKFNWGLVNQKLNHHIDHLLPNNFSLSRKRKTVIDHLDKCLKRAKQFHESLLIYNYESENPTTTCLFLGNAVHTSRVADINREGKITISKYEAGDGKILVSSALMDEREVTGWEPFLRSPVKWQAVIQIEAAHMGITESNTFADNLIYYLLTAPSRKYLKRKDYILSLMNK